jgi:hypothetical protein
MNGGSKTRLRRLSGSGEGGSLPDCSAEPLDFGVQARHPSGNGEAVNEKYAPYDEICRDHAIEMIQDDLRNDDAMNARDARPSAAKAGPSFLLYGTAEAGAPTKAKLRAAYIPSAAKSGTFLLVCGTVKAVP